MSQKNRSRPAILEFKLRAHFFNHNSGIRMVGTEC